MIKGLLFDKDGTLIDCDALWVGACRRVAIRMLRKRGIDPSPALLDEMMLEIGVTGEVSSSTGSISIGTNRDIARGFYQVLGRNGFHFDEQELVDEGERLIGVETMSDEADYRPTGDLRTLLPALRQRGYAIGLATSDSGESGRYCLRRLGVLDVFDYVGGVDGDIRPKPAPDLLQAFCSACGLCPDEVAMVGDTRNDMVFAKNGGAVAVAVLSGSGKREEFAGIADLILPDVDSLADPHLFDVF